LPRRSGDAEILVAVRRIVIGVDLGAGAIENLRIARQIPFFDEMSIMAVRGAVPENVPAVVGVNRHHGVVADVHVGGLTDLAQVAEAAGASASLSGGAERGEKQARKQADDGDDDEQFDQRKRAETTGVAGPAPVMHDGNLIRRTFHYLCDSERPDISSMICVLRPALIISPVTWLASRFWAIALRASSFARSIRRPGRRTRWRTGTQLSGLARYFPSNFQTDRSLCSATGAGRVVRRLLSPKSWC